MALLHKKATEVPADAVRLTDTEAVQYFTKVVRNWEDIGDSWPIVYGPGMLGACTVFSSFYLNNHYRMKLRLGDYGRLSSYLPAVALPAIMATLFHQTFVVPETILRREKCPVCLQTRAGVIQTGFAVAYPLLLAPISSFMFATRHFTYKLPSITEQPKEVWKLYRKMTGPITMSITVLLAFNMLAAMFLTTKEYEAIHRINLKLEKELAEDGEASYT